MPNRVQASADLDRAPAPDNPSRVSPPPNAGGSAVLQRKVSRRLIQRQAAAATTNPSSEEADREAFREDFESHFAKAWTAGGFDKLDATALSKRRLILRAPRRQG